MDIQSVDALLAELQRGKRDFSGDSVLIEGGSLDGADLSKSVFGSGFFSFMRVSLKGARLDGARLPELVGCDLTGANLSKAKIGNHVDDCNLSGADLRGAKLTASPSGCNLTNANLEGVSLKDVSFGNCDMRGVRLSGSKLDAQLTGCDLSGVDFRGVKIGWASFEGCKQVGASFAGVTAKTIVFGNADQADFTGAAVGESSFESCRGARFVNASAVESHFRCDATGADFSGADLRGADFRKATLAEAKFEGARYNRKTQFPGGFNPRRHGMVLEERARVARVAPALTRAAFVAKYGEASPIEPPTALLRQFTFGQLSPDAKRDPVFAGVFTTIGYYPSSVDPVRAETDYGQHALDLEIEKKLAAALKGAYESSAIDSEYHTFVLPAPPSGDNVDFYSGLGLSADWRDGSASFQESNVDDRDNAFLGSSDEEDRAVRYDQATLAAFRKATNVMKEHLTDLTHIGLYVLIGEPSPFPTHPIFVVGRSPSGAVIGAFALRKDAG